MTPPETSFGSTTRTLAEIRRTFLEFFKERGHTIVPSSPLVPNDPTLLFTTAGMVQFKNYYTATSGLPYTRAASVQKCLRLTDLERVGFTPRHDTFFEMLGNFSFGPRDQGAYFKEEAVAFAWEFVTGVLGLPKSRLYASIFEGEGNLPRDDEAVALWKKMGLPAGHIVALGRADNFWGPAGGKGACGPCSEIYFDLGEKRPDYLPAGAFWGEKPGDPGDRYMEFWNLVFPQFDAQTDGSLTPLARPGIDTGMGIERLALILQGKNTIFETDAFTPLVESVFEHSRAAREPNVVRDARIIADHVRALVFAIAEGSLPGNEGAGYVLRRLLRRAVTRGRSRLGLQIETAFLPHVAERAVTLFGEHYSELQANRDQTLRVIEQEEAGFTQTFEAGLGRLEELLASRPAVLAGDDAFALHDTYGFPVELTEEIAAERGVKVDREGFDRAMEGQRKRAREGSKFQKGASETRAPWTEVTEGADSAFTGYTSLAESGLSIRRWRDAGSGEFDLVLDRTPFYAESGGQVADGGTLAAGDASAGGGAHGGALAEVKQALREDDAIVHRVRITRGTPDALIAAGTAGGITATVRSDHRRPTQRHHTATHLLQAALRQTLGTHVQQKGSLVAPDRLRFDYTHFEAPSREQLAAIEREVAEWVLRNVEVSWKVMPIDEAKALGAMALFGEKYGAEVRMVTVPGVEEAGIPPSRELCGGTHVARTGDIGAFVIVSDVGVASGVRRIEALCGHEALAHLKVEAETLARAAAALQVSHAQLPDQIEKLKGEVDRLKKAEAKLQQGGIEAEMMKLLDSAVVAPQGRWVVGEIAMTGDAGPARDAADKLRGQLGRGGALVAIQGEGKLTFLAAVTDDLVSEKRLRADELVRAVAQVTGGSGGGKPHLALAGGKDLTKLADALAEARRRLEAALQ